MSMTITRDGMRGLYVITPEGPPGDPIEPVTTDSLLELSAAVAHFFRPEEDRKFHDIYKRRGLCPLCNAMTEDEKDE